MKKFKSHIANESIHDPFGMKKVASMTINKKTYDHALKTLRDVIARKKKEAGGKGMRHGSNYYAAQIARGYQGVDARTLAGMLGENENFNEGHIFEAYGDMDRGTPSLTNKYLKDTPYQKLDIETKKVVKSKDGSYTYESWSQKYKDSIDCDNPKGFSQRAHCQGKVKSFKEMNEEVTQKQIKDLEIFADRLLNKFDIDIEFTRHFADRMNDSRNNPEIKISELQQFFKKIAKEKGTNIKQNADAEVVLKDMQKDLNLPVVINYKKDRDEFEVVNKTIMRKKGFATSNKTIEYK